MIQRFTSTIHPTDVQPYILLSTNCKFDSKAGDFVKIQPTILPINLDAGKDMHNTLPCSC